MAEMESRAVRHNRRVGLWLFAVYLAFYAGFVGLVACDWKRTQAVVFAGMNLAVVCGLGLIVGAFVIALVYMGLVWGEDAAGTEAAK